MSVRIRTYQPASIHKNGWRAVDLELLAVDVAG